MKLLRALSALALACAAASAGAQTGIAPAAPPPWINQPAISQVFVFGDSLSDGGAGIASIDAACRSSAFGTEACGQRRESVRFGQPFFQQRSFSDGPVAVEVLAELLRKPLPAAWYSPFLPHFSQPGQNYALAGAHAAGTGTAYLISLPSQLNAWAHHQAGKPADPAALHVIFIGGNDLIGAIDGNRPHDVVTAVQKIQESINFLSTRGARRFLVYKLLDFADVPRYQAQSAQQRALASSVSAQFNAGIDALSAPQGATIHRFDMQAFWTFAKQFAYQQGLDYKRGCVEPAGDLFAGLKHRPGANVVLDAKVLAPCTSLSQLNDKLFFDDIHPSGLLHQWLGQASHDFIVEEMTGRCAIRTWGMDTLVPRGEPHMRRGLPGSLYAIDNTWNRKREYFRLTNLGRDSSYWYFPTNERDNQFWEYLGNTPDGQACGTAFRANVNLWDARFTQQWGGAAKGDFAPAKRNAVFLYHNPYRNEAEYFRFTDPHGNGAFGYFPIDGVSSTSEWQRITNGCLRPDGCSVVRLDREASTVVRGPMGTLVRSGE
jgi:phospholipase/lecithinase/hemolysin